MSSYLVFLKVTAPVIALSELDAARAEGHVGTVWDVDPDWHLFEVEYPAWKRAKAAPGSVAWAVPPLNRTLRRLPQALKDFLSARGAAFESGDSVADVLAELTGRDDLGR